MSLVNLLSVDIQPDSGRRYAELCGELAEKARQAQDPMHWTTHATRFGNTNTIHFAIAAEDFSELSAGGEPEEMFARLLGEQRAPAWFDEVGACIVSQRQEVSTDRPDLSYPPEQSDQPAPFAVVTVVRARPGQQDACEELIRKIAEAIPKVGDDARVVAYQTILGDLSQYWTVRPLESLADLDKQRAPGNLLTEAFGPAEGGLVFRSGREAIEDVQRSVVAFQPELSNPS